MKKEQVLLKYDFTEGAILPCLSQKIQVVVKPEDNGNRKVRLVGNELQVYLDEPTSQKVQERVLWWYKQQAKGIFAQRVLCYSRQMGVAYSHIAIKGQKTRWGSCSSKQNLNFNWKLLFLPMDLLDYVVVHQLAHLKQMNHTKEFWAVVEENMPDYKIWKEQLKGYTLS